MTIGSSPLFFTGYYQEASAPHHMDLSLECPHSMAAGTPQIGWSKNEWNRSYNVFDNLASRVALHHSRNVLLVREGIYKGVNDMRWGSLEAVLEVGYHMHCLANILGSVVPVLVDEGPLGSKCNQENKKLSK